MQKIVFSTECACLISDSPRLSNKKYIKVFSFRLSLNITNTEFFYRFTVPWCPRWQPMDTTHSQDATFPAHHLAGIQKDMDSEGLVSETRGTGMGVRVSPFQEVKGNSLQRAIGNKAL
jgi:hypothetical protein